MSSFENDSFSDGGNSNISDEVKEPLQNEISNEISDIQKDQGNQEQDPNFKSDNSIFSDNNLQGENSVEKSDSGANLSDIIKQQLIPETEDGIKVEDALDVNNSNPENIDKEFEVNSEDNKNNEIEKNDSREENSDKSKEESNKESDFSDKNESDNKEDNKSTNSNENVEKENKSEHESEKGEEKHSSEDFDENKEDTPRIVRRKAISNENITNKENEQNSAPKTPKTPLSDKESKEWSDSQFSPSKTPETPNSPKSPHSYHSQNEKEDSHHSDAKDFEDDDMKVKDDYENEKKDENEKEQRPKSTKSTSRSKKRVKNGDDKEYEYEYVEEYEEEEPEQQKEEDNDDKQNQETQAEEEEEEDIPEEEVEAALELILDGADPAQDFEPRILKKVVVKLTDLKNAAHQEENYVDAEAYSQLMKRCQKAVDLATFTDQCVKELDKYRGKQNDAQMVIDELNNYWDNEFKDFEDVIEEKKGQLIQQHTKELDDFDQNIPTELPAKYQKHSPEYIVLRRKQRALARNQEFVEAERIKRQADKLERVENTKQLKKLQEDLQFQRDMLIDKQNRQVERFAQWVTERRNLMLTLRDKQMQGSINRLNHYTMVVNNIEKHGLPPNPTNGFTTNRVSREESIRAVRTAAATPLSRSTTTPSRKGGLPFSYRPQSSVTKRKSQIITPVSKKNGRKKN